MKLLFNMLFILITYTCYSQDGVFKYHVKKFTTRFKNNDGSWQQWKPLRDSQLMDTYITVNLNDKFIIWDSKVSGQKLKHTYLISNIEADITDKDYGFSYVSITVINELKNTQHFRLYFYNVSDRNYNMLLEDGDFMQSKYDLE